MNPTLPETKNPLTKGKIISTQTDPEVYFRTGGQRGKPDFVMSRGELVEFDWCPSRWLAGYASEETKATQWGSLIDALALDGDGFEKRFAVTPETFPPEKGGDKPWNWNATYCKEWRKAEEDDGKEVVKFETHKEAKQAATWLMEDARIENLIEHSDKQMMVMAEYYDRETNFIVPIKILIDLVPKRFIQRTNFEKSLADLKTCASAALRPWTKAVFEHSYHWQAAMYLDAYNAATGEDRTDFLHILQESYPPYQTARRILSVEFVELGRMKYLAALKRYCQCLATGIWPDYDSDSHDNLNGWTLVDVEPYMI